VALWLLVNLRYCVAIVAFLLLLALAARASTALFKLEVGMKAKAIHSDNPPSSNILTKVVLWLFGS